MKTHFRTNYYANTDFTACGRKVRAGQATEALAEVTCSVCRAKATKVRTATPEELDEETRRYRAAKER